MRTIFLVDIENKEIRVIKKMNNNDIILKEWKNDIPIKSGDPDPKKNKIPLIKFKPYIDKPFPKAELKKFEPCNHAVMCGITNDNLLILDWDFKEGKKGFFKSLFLEFSKRFPKLSNTYIVDTPHGYHFYYYMEDFLETRHPIKNALFKFNKKLDKDVFTGLIKTKYYEHLAGWDILGQKGYALIPPSELGEGLNYTVHNDTEVCNIALKEFNQVKDFFLLEKSKKPRKPFIDIMNGTLQIEEYAIENDKDEFVYWKNLFREMWHYCGMEPYEVYRFLENQNAFDKDKCDVQLGHHPYTDNPLSNEYMKKYFPDYYTHKTTIKNTEIVLENTGITLSEIPTTTDQNNNQDDVISKYEIRDIILNNHDIKVIIENGEFLLYEDGIYIRDQKRRVKSMVKHYLEELEIPYTFAYLRDLIELLENDDTLVGIEEIDKNPYILNLNNGLLDVKTLKLRKHTPKHLSFRRIPIDYIKNAKCPNVEKFIEDIFKKEDISLIYEMTGLCLTPDMDFQRAFLFYGSGNNGKTTFFNLVIKLINKKNCSDIDLVLLQNTFFFSQLESKLLNIVSDVDSTTKLKIQVFKNYVGNASFITVNKKNKPLYKTIPTAKLLYSCNSTFPKIPLDTDKGFFRKWITIECPNDFDGIEDIKIFERLSTAEELSGLLNKSIEGLRRLIIRERFDDKYNNWEEVKDLWFLKINDFAEFIELEAEIDYKFKADKNYTLKKFNQYLIDKGKKPVKKTMLTKFVNESPNYHTNRTMINNKRTPHYTGFRLEGDPINKNKKPLSEFL